MDENTNEKGKNKQILKDLRARWKTCLEAEDENRRAAMADIKFAVVPGNQWDENQKKQRGDRPAYEFNKIRVTAKRIINNMRINRPAGKVRGTEDADKDTAEIYEGLIRNIWARSKGDTVIDSAAEYQVISGYGAWRVDTDFTDDDVFEQDISIAGIHNPFCLFGDPSDKDILKRDARYWILTERMPKEEFEAKYKDKDIVEFPSHEFDDDEDWQTDEDVRIAEYWYKEPYQKEIWQLIDGKVVDASEDIPQEMIKKGSDGRPRSRVVDTHKIMMCIASGNSILEGPIEWAGTMFPFVPVYGEYYIVDGKVYWNGITRFAKDPQRSYNVSRTAITETIAQAPQAKYWVTQDQSEGHTDVWKEAHMKNFPFLVYNPDPLAPGPPARMGSADVPVALIQEAQMAAEEINMVTGVYQADLGAPNQASSGVQEGLRQQAGHIATFNYQDNQAAAIERTWEILVDLIPRIYDSERSLRVLGQDDKEDYVRINTSGVDPKTGEPIPTHDLATGKYDVAITVGPNFTTKRQEAADTYQALLQSSPEMFPIIGDLIFKSMDLPYSEEIAERLKVMLPPQIQQMLNEGQDIPPEAQAIMAQAQQAMQMVEQQAMAVQEAANEADMKKSDVEKLIADLEKKQAQFEAKVAQEAARLTKQEAGLTKQQAQMHEQALESDSAAIIEIARQQAEQNTAAFQQSLAEQVTQALTGIKDTAEQFGLQAVVAVEEIQKAAEKPKIKEVKAVRENGQLKAVPVYFEDEPTIQ